MLRKSLVAVLTFLIIVTTGSAALAWAPPAGPTFNNPKGSEAAKYRLLLRVEKAISNTPRGATILISTYLLDRVRTVDRLVGAHGRGVHVRVVLDGGINTGPAARLKRVLNRDNGRAGLQYGPDQSFAVQCRGSCRGGGENQAMHTKFYAFSRTGTAANVVMVSSGNLNRGGAKLGYNDLFTMRGVPSTFRVYHRVHDELARDRVDGNPYVVHREGRFLSRFFPKRGATRGSDPTYEMLERVHCHGASGGAGRGGRTILHVSMFFWGGDRGVYLARRLVELANNGCSVNIIYGAPTKAVSDILRRSDGNGGVKLFDSRQDRNGDGQVDLRVHTKYLLINGNWGADNSSWQVLTGSQNWVDNALTGGDENTLQINSRGAHNQYKDNWVFVRNHGARPVGGS